MNIKTCHLYLTDKLNKLSSNFNQNLPFHSTVRAINEAMYYWLDERLKVEERDKTIQRELQFLIINKELSPVLIEDKFNEYDIPEDYYHPSLLTVDARLDQCFICIHCNLIENANVSMLLNDEVTRPDYDWEQCFYTIRNNRIAIYKDSDITKNNYDLDKIVLYYYRKPINVNMASNHLDELGILTTDVDLEFPESSSYEILDIAAKILAGNINDQGRFQYNSQLTQEYK